MAQVVIEDWGVVAKTKDIYKAPEQFSSHLSGKVFGHPLHEDGKNVVTSSIMHVCGKEIFTRNTKYVLGKVSQEYKNWYFEFYGKEINEENPFLLQGGEKFVAS